MSYNQRVLLALVAVSLIGCGGPTYSSVQVSPSVAPAGSTNSDVLDQKELSRSGTSESLLDVLRRVRPSFLSVGGRQPSVSIDGASATTLSVLASIPVGDVREVRLVRAIFNNRFTAISPDGSAAVGDVLLVSTK